MNILFLFFYLFKFFSAPLFQRVTAALTTSQSGTDIKGMFDNLIRQAISHRKR
jgi:hypothetical protein